MNNTTIEHPNLSTIPATAFKRNSGSILKRVAVRNEHILIERNGFPVAVIIPVEVYRQFVARHNS